MRQWLTTKTRRFRSPRPWHCDIDPDRAIAQLVPMIDRRRDWPKTRVSTFLRMAGSEKISEPMFRAIRSADNRGKTYLLQFAQLVESSVLDAAGRGPDPRNQ